MLFFSRLKQTNKKQCKTAFTQTLRNTHTTDFPPAAPPSHQYIEKSAASKHSQIHIYTPCAENTRREIYASKSKERMHLTTNYFACFLLLKKKLNSDWYLAKIYCFRASAVRNVVDFVLFYDSLNRAEKYQHKHTIHTGKKKSLWAIVKHTNTTTTLAHTESDTKRVEHGTKGWNKSELEHVQDTNTETLSRVDTWDTYTLNNTNTTNIHTYIQTYTHMWH